MAKRIRRASTCVAARIAATSNRSQTWSLWETTSLRSTPRPDRQPRAHAERPEVVARRSRYGDWEGDTVVGSRHQGAVATLVERKSGYLVAGRMPDGRSASLNRAAQRVLSPLPSDLLHTLSVDNGAEFARHESLSRAVGMPIYFADPYCSNQRALNENTNGLRVSTTPKGTSFLDITHQDLARVVDRLNNRPRKRLNYQTPREVLLDAGFALEM
jgi:IS30 family transposase